MDDLGVIIMRKRCSIQQGEKTTTVDQSKVLKNRLFRFYWATRYRPSSSVSSIIYKLLFFYLKRGVFWADKPKKKLYHKSPLAPCLPPPPFTHESTLGGGGGCNFCVIDCHWGSIIINWAIDFCHWQWHCGATVHVMHVIRYSCCLQWDKPCVWTAGCSAIATTCTICLFGLDCSYFLLTSVLELENFESGNSISVEKYISKFLVIEVFLVISAKVCDP